MLDFHFSSLCRLISPFLSSFGGSYQQMLSCSSSSFCLHLMMIFCSGGYETQHEWKFPPTDNIHRRGRHRMHLFLSFSSACVALSSFCLSDLMCWIFTFPHYVVLFFLFLFFWWQTPANAFLFIIFFLFAFDDDLR